MKIFYEVYNRLEDSHRNIIVSIIINKDLDPPFPRKKISCDRYKQILFNIVCQFPTTSKLWDKYNNLKQKVYSKTRETKVLPNLSLNADLKRNLIFTNS